MCGRGRYSLHARRSIAGASRGVRSERPAPCHAGPRTSTSTFGSEVNNQPVDVAILRQTADCDGEADKLPSPVENLSPGMVCPVLLYEEGAVKYALMTWGLVPLYSEASSKPDHYKLFNKRLDSLLKPG